MPVLPQLLQTLRCLGNLVLYLVPCVVVLLALHAFAKVPKLVFRKLLHVVAFSCIAFMVSVAESWQAAALASVTVALAIYPILSALESQPWYADLFVQKSPGEVKRSLLMLFSMFAAIVSVAWGLFGRPELATASILMWGTGDAAAALVGVPLGKHKVSLGWADGKKSWEGSAAMFVVSLVSGLAVLQHAGYARPQAFLLCAASALVGTIVELFSPSEYDTVTVPTAMLAVLLALR